MVDTSERRRVIMDADLVLATPLFCAGATNNDVDFRASSVKGVLRWWWRALAYPEAVADKGQSHTALRVLAERERSVFGGVGSDGGQKSRVVCRVDAIVGPGAAGQGLANRYEKYEKGRKLLGSDGRVVGPGARYLGYGLMVAFGQDAGKLNRACLVGGTGGELVFKVQLVSQGLGDDEIMALERAIRAWGHLGGLGARSRRGWGSVALKELKKYETEGVGAPGKSLAEGSMSVGAGTTSSPVVEGQPDYGGLVAQVEQLLDYVPVQAELWPPFSAFGPTMRVVVARFEGQPLEALNELGAEMVRYRSWGFRGKVLDKKEQAERNFPGDHDLMKSRGTRASYPRRLVFGLPHNYGRSSRDQVVPVLGVRRALRSGEEERKGDRRASPLLVHVHPLRDGSSAVVLTLLPAVFLPGKPPKVSVGGDEVDLAQPDKLYQTLNEFLDRVSRNEKNRFAETRYLLAGAGVGRGSDQVGGIARSASPPGEAGPGRPSGGGR